jgi:hypothetical protein
MFGFSNLNSLDLTYYAGK